MLWSNWPPPIPHHSLPPTSKKIYFLIPTEVCFIQMWISPSHTHCFIVSSLIDSRLTSTPPCSTPALASNTYNLFISNPSPQVPFSFNHVPPSLMSQLTTHVCYLSLPYTVFECHHNIWNQPVSTTIPFPSPFCNSTTTETHRHFGQILIDIFENFFLDRMALQWRKQTNLLFTHINKLFLSFVINPRTLNFSQIVFNLCPIPDPWHIGLPQQLHTPPTNYTTTLPTPSPTGSSFPIITYLHYPKRFFPANLSCSLSA